MRGSASRRSFDSMRLLLLTALLLLTSAATAGAAQVSYIDQGQVWVSTLDGTQKRAISGAAPEGRTWTEQTQSDDGWIIGVARASGGTGAAAPTKLWNPSGGVAAESTLGYHGAYNNGGLVMPLGLALTPGGQQLTYGYQDMVYGYPTSTLYNGTWVANTSNSSGEPFDIPSLVGSSLVGSRWVGINANASSADNNIVVEPTGAQGPFSTSFTPWFHATGAWSVDMAADGSAVGVIFRLTNDAPYVLGLFAANGLGETLPGPSCDLPATGTVHEASISPDGKWLAWTDDRGLLVAPMPALNAGSPCPVAAPTVISSTGRYPSIGATTLATPPASTTTTPTSPGTTPSSSKPTVTLAKSVKASAFAKGLALVVSVKAKGTVTATAKVGRTTLAKGSKQAAKAGKVTLRLKASKKLARRLSRYRGKTLTLTVKAPGGSVTLTRKLR